ncbi:MAG TPA: energy-coupling factor ABC transporter permease [Geobacter sp.]|nr:energy-coupling factor ABC transporter permease [Geobacter sp.]
MLPNHPSLLCNGVLPPPPLTGGGRGVGEAGNGGGARGSCRGATAGARSVLLAIVIVLCATPAFAMHISEGILPFPWALLWSLVALPFVAIGVRRLNLLAREDLSLKPLVGLMTAVVFIVSCLPVPVPTAGTCSHPCGTGISAILVGPLVSVLIAAVSLLIQALFLAHGGLSTLGANTLSMGVVGSFVGFLAFRGLRRVGASLVVSGFVAGLLADWGTYAATSLFLSLGIRGDAPLLPLFTRVLLAFMPTQLPLGIIEGVATAGMVRLLYRKRPDLLLKMRVITEKELPSHA